MAVSGIWLVLGPGRTERGVRLGDGVDEVTVAGETPLGRICKQAAPIPPGTAATKSDPAEPVKDPVDTNGSYKQNKRMHDPPHHSVTVEYWFDLDASSHDQILADGVQLLS